MDKERQKIERKERAVKEREEKIKAERGKVEADIDRSRHGLHKSESEMEFRCAAYSMCSSISYAAPLTLLPFDL